MKYYAGIGSRETPIDILNKMSLIALALANDNWILRSGGAKGADSAFDLKSNSAKIYLPYNGFNGLFVDNKRYLLPANSKEVESFVWDYHPAPERLGPTAFKFMVRNTYQVLGEDLKTPSSLIVCWTADGKASGGTGQAIRIAKDYNIEVINLFNKEKSDKQLKEHKIILA